MSKYPLRIRANLCLSRLLWFSCFGPVASLKTHATQEFFRRLR